MIKADRHARIMSILEDSQALTLPELARRLGRVSTVTVRRDVAELAARGLLRRAHGSVTGNRDAAPELERPSSPSIEDQIGDVDAIILPPIEGRGADTLRGMARRRQIPFLAESSEQQGGVYVGPDNFAVGRELGKRAGAMLANSVGTARILLVSLERLPNTRSRCDGFLKGFGEAFNGPVESWRVDGRGSYRDATNVSVDALTVHRGINVAFGVNDHSILAALEAAEALGITALHGFSVGGEGGALFEALTAGSKLRACAALFPEIVGTLAIDALADALTGAMLPARIATPHAVLTKDNLGDFYRLGPGGWTLSAEAEARLLGKPRLPRPAGPRRVIGFVPHYPAHDWYRNMIRAMRQRTAALGLELRVAAPQAGIAREIQALRRIIAKAAAERVRPGEIVALNAGEASLMLADELTRTRDITVVTNSLDVMERLTGLAGLKLILTSGEYDPRHRCLVGPSLGALFETLRVDRAFLSVDGLTARFGPSAADERLALAARRLAEAARETVVLADHSLVGVDASNRIVPMSAVAEVLTDAGSLPADRLQLAAQGSVVSIADHTIAEALGPPAAAPPPRPAAGRTAAA